ncbi:MAG: flagellin, partial [Hydrogenophaga sp.]|uniref:flagellin n=1 Tax=Hydrogenophaga sp. TaxID=1904254 RepID=UPI002725BAD5
KQLSSEIDRVAKTTSFNGTKLLDGSFANATFQVGANAGEGIAIDSIVSANSSTLGETSLLTVAGTQTTTVGANAAIAAGALTVKGTALGPISAAASAGERSQQVVDAINAKSSDTGVFARATYTGAAVTGWEVFSDTAIAAADFNAGFTAATTGAAPAGPGVAASSQLNDINVSSFGDAQKALKVIDNAINAVNSSRADLGALQSRFENAVANIQITGENISAARGRIVDADFAKETSNLSRAQILQQAGTAMVAQANQAQQGVLSLLR